MDSIELYVQLEVYAAKLVAFIHLSICRSIVFLCLDLYN
jgi:hypothetical protein